MTAVVLPDLEVELSPASSSRRGIVPHLIAVHRWGNQPARTKRAAESRLTGNVRYMSNPDNEVSAHIVYGGSLVDHSVQLVPWQEKAWTQAAYNPACISIESCDAVWTRDRDGVIDDTGLRQLARIIGYLCGKTGIPPSWSRNPASDPGVVRHMDLGKLGNPNGHTCPTDELTLWRQFIGMVKAEVKRGGYRDKWGIGTFTRIDV